MPYYFVPMFGFILDGTSDSYFVPPRLNFQQFAILIDGNVQFVHFMMEIISTSVTVEMSWNLIIPTDDLFHWIFLFSSYLCHLSQIRTSANLSAKMFALSPRLWISSSDAPSSPRKSSRSCIEDSNR